MGVLREVDHIGMGALTGDAASGPVVLLVKAASGDEEVGAAGIDLRGVLLCHSLPHLSHLGTLRTPCPPACDGDPSFWTYMYLKGWLTRVCSVSLCKTVFMPLVVESASVDWGGMQSCSHFKRMVPSCRHYQA